MQLRLLIVQFQRDLQGAQFLRVQAQLGALLAVAVEHQHLLVQRLLPLRAAQLRVELRRRRCGHQCAGRSGRLRWAGGGQGDGVVERRWLLRIARRQRLCGACTFAVGRLRERRLALSPSVADVFAPVSDGAGMPMNARRFYHRPPRCSAGHCRAAAQSLVSAIHRQRALAFGRLRLGDDRGRQHGVQRLQRCGIQLFGGGDRRLRRFVAGGGRFALGALS